MGVEGGECSALPITQRVLESSKKEINYNKWDDALCQAILLLQKIKCLHRAAKYERNISDQCIPQLLSATFCEANDIVETSFKRGSLLLHYISDVYYCAHSTESPKIGFHSHS